MTEYLEVDYGGVPCRLRREPLVWMNAGVQGILLQEPCRTQGHCRHEGTAINSVWCCKCNQYLQEVEAR
jgi:hypothetical protein